MSFRCDFRCPHCQGALAVTPLVKNGDGALAAGTLEHGPDPDQGETVRNNQVQPLQSQERRQRRASAETKRQAQEQDQRSERRQNGVKDGNLCPTHGKATPSRFGGLYCPTPDKSSPSGWCSWRPGKQEAA